MAQAAGLSLRNIWIFFLCYDSSYTLEVRNGLYHNIWTLVQSRNGSRVGSLMTTGIAKKKKSITNEQVHLALFEGHSHSSPFRRTPDTASNMANGK